MLTVMFLVATVGSAYLHNPTNTINFHDGIMGVGQYIIVGFANFFWGIWMSLCHFGGDVLSIPEKMSGCPFWEYPVGWIFGSLVHLFFWAIPESLMYWGLNHLITKESCWGLFLIILFLVAGGAKGGGGGGGGHKPSGGGGGHDKH